MNAEETKPRVQLTGPGFSVDRTVPEEIAQRILLLILTGEAKTPIKPALKEETSLNQPTNTDESSGEAIVAEKAVAEIFTEANAKRNPDKIACIAYFYKTQMRRPYISKAGIIDGFVQAGESAPGNLARDLAWTKQQGWIALKPGEKDTYYLTNGGTKAVQARFPDEIKKSQPGSKVKTKTVAANAQ